MNKHLKIGLFGFGCVGQGLFDCLNQTKGIKADIVKTCVKDRSKKRSIPMENFTFDKNELLNNREIDIIVELIDDADAAFEIVCTAMKNGKGVVTANKKMVAEHFEELFQLQHKCNVPFLYEASSCASIPIIRNLEEYYDNDLLDSVEGIFNGSTNYILSKMFDEGIAYGDALKQAQKMGFVESDPTLDIGGFDAKYKLSIVTAHAFGLFIPPEKIFNYGIGTLSTHDMQFAREKSCKIKLLAKSKKFNDHLGVWVMPQFIPKGHRLYFVENEYNGIILESAFSDKQFFLGKGAGSHPTGTAVLSDISALTYQYKYEYKKYHQDYQPTFTNDFVIELYVRYKNETSLNKIKFLTINENFKGKDFNYVIGKVKLKELMDSPLLQDKEVFIIQTSRDSRELAQNL